MLLAVDEILRQGQLASNGRQTNENSAVYYFPAYEILLDELRDYRFYAEDMLHPSEQAVNIIWQRFVTWAFTKEAETFAQEWERTERDLAHRPMNPDSEAHKAFLAKVMERRKLLETKNKLQFSTEK